MGEIVGLCVGNYDFLLSKNTFNDSLSIFNKENLTIEKVFEDELQTSGAYRRICLFEENWGSLAVMKQTLPVFSI